LVRSERRTRQAVEPTMTPNGVEHSEAAVTSRRQALAWRRKTSGAPRAAETAMGSALSGWPGDWPRGSKSLFSV
jgi:hypothetical protein